MDHTSISGHTSISIGPTLFAVLAALALLGAGVVGWARLGPGRAVLGASARAAVQLAAVSAIILLVLGSWWSTVAFVGVMYVVAAGTSAGRVTGRRIDWSAPLSTGRVGWATLLPIGLGITPALTLLLATRAVPPTPLAVLPTAGILIGGAMTATSLAGRRAFDELRNRRGEYEAGLALGLSDRDAAMEVCRSSAGHALIPALDQTRTVGLVTLPGAFVGVLLGGAGPVQAGATQLLILVALLAVEAVAIAATVELVARQRLTDFRTPGGSGTAG
ncbi:ABC transporter permease [Plantactinospora solaniradicis]|uniref:ABC transporter permease n=1 Tax=Plantactinospora solaniradicis TaxID=1723736 RepID=A0ABW1K125_9ACTN